MSERQNLELMRRAFEFFNRGDVESAIELMDPEVEWRPNPEMPDIELVYRGPGEVRRFLRDFMDPWETITIESLEARAHGDEIVMLIRFQATGRDGIEVDILLTHRYTLRAGRILAFQSYPDHAQALADAGID